MASVNVSNGANGSPDKCSSPTTNNPSDVIPDVDAEEESLQKLIESELALRIAAVKETPPDDLLVGLQTDFFSTTQYESPSDEIPPTSAQFDPFTTTVEQSPTFPGFSEDEVKEFNQDPFCSDLLSPTSNDSELIKSKQVTGSSAKANVDLLADLDPINDTLDLSPTPPEPKNLIDDLSGLDKFDLIQNSYVESENGDIKINNSSKKNLDLNLQDQIIDPITQTIDISPSPPPENIVDELHTLDDEEMTSSPKAAEEVLDPINQTIDLSPSPPLEVADNSTEDIANEMQDLSPTKSLINESMDKSPTPPSDKMEEPLDPFDDESDIENFAPPPHVARIPQYIRDEVYAEIILPAQPDDLPPLVNGFHISGDVDLLVAQSNRAPIVYEDISPPDFEDDENNSPPMIMNGEYGYYEEEMSPNGINGIDHDSEEVDQSPPLELNHESESNSSAVVDNIPDENVEGVQDPIYQTYDMSPSPPVENMENVPDTAAAALDEQSSNVEIVITEHCESETAPVAVVDHFAPPVGTLEIDGFETWTVAGAEEEEDEAPPMQKSLLPERPTSLPHVVCADTTNIVETVGEEMITPSSEDTPSSEGSPTKKKTSKKTKSSGDVKTKKSKKTKKCEEKENISVGGTADTAPQQCRACGTQVFQMEQVKAEKAVWHKNCFRCKECNKQLTVDTYGSNEGQLYCKPHFKDLFKPKAVAIEEPALLRARRPEMIIRENQPEELPPDVVRASDKPDLGLEELSSLNVKSRFQVFERSEETNEVERSSSTVNVKRSPSILSKLARFQAKGMDVGVTDDSLHGIPVEQSSSEDEDEEEEDENAEETVVKAKVKRERPQSFAKMDDVRSMWATGQAQRREEQREERKEEVQKLRSRLFMGKCGKVKEMYEQAVQESASTKTSSQQRAAEVRSEKARSIKERFEKGEPMVSDSEDADEQDNKKNNQEDLSVFEAGISKKSRSLFLELDSAAKSQQQSPQSQSTTPRTPLAKPELRRPAKEEDSPERPVYRDPDVVRADDRVEEEELVRSQTASRMLSLFRQMEEKAGKEEVHEGPKPLKRFTPPPDYKKGDSEGSEEEESEEDEEESEGEESDEEGQGESGVVRASDKVKDEFLRQALSANSARAKTLRAKFEQWESSAPHLNGQGREDEEDDEEREGRECLESTSSLRARFESLSAQPIQPILSRDKPKVNRFVVPAVSEECRACEKKLYPMERLEAGGNLYHRKCFRCLQCNCILRLESFTVNQGNLYCLAHFRQLFIARGNYDEGFGKAAPSPPASVDTPTD